MVLRYSALLSICAIGNAWVARPPLHARHRPLPLRSSAPTSEDQEPSAEFLESYLSRFSGASTSKTVDGVEFVKFDNTILFGKDDPRAAVDNVDEPKKEVLLYMPGLDFTGVSGCGALPALSSRYEVWWTRVENTYRGDFAAIAATVSDQVIALSEGGQRKVTLLGESFGGLLALGVALRVRDHATVNAASESLDDAAAAAVTSSTSVLRGVVLVNAASGFDQTPWLTLGSLLAKLPSETLADLDLPTALTTALAAGGISQLPRVSPFSAVAAAVLATTVPDVSQVVRGTSGLLGDLLTNNGPEAAASKAAARASQAIGALDRLATILAPDVLQFRLEKWLKAGCEEVNPRLAELGDTKEAAAAAAAARKSAGVTFSNADFFATDVVGGGLPILALAGEEDRMLPSSSEAMRLVSVLGKRTASGKILAGVGHAALDDRPNFLDLIDASPLGLATKAEALLKAQENKPLKPYDYVTDFKPPSSTQLEAARASLQNLRTAVSPVFISTDAATGKRRFGLESVPLPKDVNRPVLLVGNHQLLALDLGIMVEEFARTTGSLPRGLAHPATFVDPASARGDGRRQRVDPLEVEESTAGPFSPFANFRKAQAAAFQANQGTNDPPTTRDPVVAFNGVGSIQEFGAVPVTPKNFYKMMQQNEFALLFPGGAREATHGKGEDYALFWPKDRAADFVRVAAKFDALIVPFGAVGAAVNEWAWKQFIQYCNSRLLSVHDFVFVLL